MPRGPKKKIVCAMHEDVSPVPAARLRVAGIVNESVVDGPGLRLVVFAQGCPHHCPGCHNPETHDPDGGRDMALEEIAAQYLENPLLSGITFSGGEPFAQAQAFALLGKKIAGLGGNIITYSGYTFEELLSGKIPGAASLLAITDLLIDGPYIQELRSLELPFRGSSNQRILDRQARVALAAGMAKA